jgi:dTDP-4-amino-4,6-dideoxy-D-galactose acyltransferase
LADAWLAETLRRPTYRWKGQSEEIAEEGLSEEMADLANGGDAFFFARVPTDSVAKCTALTREGFSVVDTGVTFTWVGRGDSQPSAVSVGVARREQHEAVARIAERCFRWSRFHLDPRIPVELANLIKRRWIENYCRGQRGAALYVGEINKEVAGFLAVIESRVGDQTAAVIDLIGVAPELQGHSVGTALVRFFVDEWRDRVAQLRVGTQVANVRSMRFYERSGFRVVESTYVLHAHYREGELLR